MVMVLPFVPPEVQMLAGLAVKVTGLPDAPPVALTVKGASPYVLLPSAPNVIAWFAWFTPRVPLPVEESPGTDGLDACTVKPVEPAGVAAVVLIVNVDDLEVSEVPKLRVLGLNEAVAPLGNEV